jgi:hypothetical protein
MRNMVAQRNSLGLSEAVTAARRRLDNLFMDARECVTKKRSHRTPTVTEPIMTGAELDSFERRMQIAILHYPHALPHRLVFDFEQRSVRIGRHLSDGLRITGNSEIIDICD